MQSVNREAKEVKSDEEEFVEALGLNGSSADPKWKGRAAAFNRIKPEPRKRKRKRGLFVDLVALWKSGIKPEKPTIARVSKDRCLFYKGRINEVHGEPSVGKTNIAMFTVTCVLNEGKSVIYLDPEDNEFGFLSRLIGLGLADTPLLIEQLLQQVHYIPNPSPQEIDDALAYAKENDIELVVYDGLAEGMAAENLDEDKARDTLQFMRRRLRPFAAIGCGVLILDHVVKSKSDQGRWSRGSGAKIGRYDGVSYIATEVVAYDPKTRGKLSLRIAKDRNGGAGPARKLIGFIHFTPSESGITKMSWEELEPTTKKERRTHVMRAVFNYVKENPDCSKRDLRNLPFKSQTIDEAIGFLIADGYLKLETDGGKHQFVILKSYQS